MLFIGDLRQLRDKSSSRRAWRSRSREGKRNAVESDQESDEEVCLDLNSIM